MRRTLGIMILVRWRLSALQHTFSESTSSRSGSIILKQKDQYPPSHSNSLELEVDSVASSQQTLFLAMMRRELFILGPKDLELDWRF